MKKAIEEEALKLLENSLRPILHELNELDWKIDISESGDRVARHLSAFSNYSGGGFLVFGINNAGERIGVDETQCTDIIKKLGNVARDGLDPAITIDHMSVTVDGKALLFVYLREAESKPVHLRQGTIYDSYTRSAGQTRKMNKQEVALAISQSSNLTFETKLATSALSSEEILEKLDFTAYFDLIKKPLPKETDGIIDVLALERLIKKVDDGFCITNLGAILFAKNITDFKDLERKAPRLIIYAGKDRLNRVREVDGQMGYASGFTRLIEFINALLPSNEVIKQDLRQEVKMYPDLAIRELVANALIHQDFDVTGTGPTIEIFDDRIEIRNPGRPLVKTERFLDSPPHSRNEALASLMRRLRVCEESGTGIDKVVSQCEFYQLPAPSFVVTDDHLTATLFSPRTLTKMAKEDRVRACYLHACLKSVSQGVMTNESIRKRFKISDKNYPLASKIISETLAEGWIKPRSPESKSRKYAQYLPFWA